jgi:hypothetical protein
MAGDVRLISWIEKHRQQGYTSSIVIAQLAFWVRTKPGKRRAAMHMWLTQLVETTEVALTRYAVKQRVFTSPMRHALNSRRNGRDCQVSDLRA